MDVYNCDNKTEIKRHILVLPTNLILDVSVSRISTKSKLKEIYYLFIFLFM